MLCWGDKNIFARLCTKNAGRSYAQRWGGGAYFSPSLTFLLPLPTFLHSSTIFPSLLSLPPSDKLSPLEVELKYNSPDANEWYVRVSIVSNPDMLDLEVSKKIVSGLVFTL